MIRHILLFQFTDNASPDQINAIRHAFLRIPKFVTGVTHVEWGANNSPEGINSGYTHSVLMTFAGETARQRYLTHPAHKALKSIFRIVLRDIVVLDFTLEPENITGRDSKS